MISLIVATDRNLLIGQDGDLPWRLPADLKFFKRTTLNHSILMGRKTYDSIGRPLPKRRNIVLTRSQDFEAEGCEVYRSLDDLCNELRQQLENPEEEFFVIGGGAIYKEFLPKCQRVYRTEIQEEFEGDTYFPELDLDAWEEVSRQKNQADDNNPYDYDFVVYERKN